MLDGFDFVVVAMGLFGISEVLVNLEAPEARKSSGPLSEGFFRPGKIGSDAGGRWPGLHLRFFIGVLPGGEPS